MSALDTLSNIAGRNTVESVVSHSSREKIEHIKSQFKEHARVTFDQLKVASYAQTRDLEQWVNRLENDGIELQKSDWFIPWSKNAIQSARELSETFEISLKKAEQKGIISKDSAKEWRRRFANPNASYKQKEYWIHHQLPTYYQNWEKVGAERKELMAKEGFGDLLSYDPEFKKIQNLDAFLALHFDERKGILAAARGALRASNQLQLDLYAKAKGKLSGAASKKFLSDAKIGLWLERTFKRNADPKKIQEFVNGNGPNSLNRLMENWLAVKLRYDRVAEKLGKLGEDTMPRGLHFYSERQFLPMHYEERLRYVEEVEQRLGDSPNPQNELPIFLQVRHAMDMKDWGEAQLLIAEAKQQGVSGGNLERLRSMENFVKQFGVAREGRDMANVTKARNRLDFLVQQLGSSHSEVAPMVTDLLRGPHANRNINQFCWITKNNIWCRTHGPPYLNDHIARKGASEDNEQLTKYRAKRGMDIGRNDVLDYETADKEYFQKKEHSTHKATYLHTNIQSGGVRNSLGEWLKREQDPRVLYWTTFCPHADGDPKSMNWNQDLLMILSEMRSLTRTIGDAGYACNGPSRKLTGVNESPSLALAL